MGADKTQRLEKVVVPVSASSSGFAAELGPARDDDTGTSRLCRDAYTLNRIARLDPFPPVVQRLVAMTGDATTSLNDVERLLSTDVPLTARVLRLAGSSLYGRRPPPNLRAALLRIGMHELRRLVVTATTATGFDALSAELWRYSLRCGLLSRGLTLIAKVTPAADPFLCGLLHDIGVLMMFRLHGQAYGTLHGAPGHDGLDQLELEAYGHTHGDVGGVVVSRWHLMTALDYIVQYHHDVVWSAGLDLQPRLRDLLAIVVLARYLAIDAPTHEEDAAREVVRLRLGLRESQLVPVIAQANEELAELGALLAA
ncbi:MAG: HDOD domain-containing protein [Deltaproteobacteria bacterium]|nr:HDOD domain-containing protein [Deltaproteobacteria bacterium]